MSFTINSQTFADVNTTKIHAELGLGFYRLVFQVDFVFYPRPQGESATLVELGGEVKVKGKAGGPYYLGRLVSRSRPLLIEVRQYTNKRSETLEIELDHRRLEAIEEIRLGEGLTFTLSWWGRVLLGSVFHNVFHEDSFPVNQGTWIEILGQCGYSRTMLLEVPVPDTESAPVLAEAVSRLKKAQEALVRGEYREAVGACRDVLESLSQVLADRDDQDQEFQQLFQNTRGMDKEARLRVVRRALKILCHPARHADLVSAQIYWDRADAIAVVTMVSALLQDYM